MRGVEIKACLFGQMVNHLSHINQNALVDFVDRKERMNIASKETQVGFDQDILFQDRLI